MSFSPFHSNPELETTTDDMLDKFTVAETLGQGGQGSVCKAVEKDTGLRVAIKVEPIMEHGVWHDVGSANILREVFFLSSLSHPYIVHFHSATSVLHFKGTKKMWIATEQMDCDLWKYIAVERQHHRLVPVPTIKRFLCMILKALRFIHNSNIVHRDMKPMNILVDIEESIVKIADFGLAIQGHGSFSSNRSSFGTLGYRPPEVLFGYETYGNAVDIWGAAVIFAELAGGMSFFECSRNRVDEMHAQGRIFGTPEDLEPANPEIRNLVPEYRRKTDDKIKSMLGPDILRIGTDGVDLLMKMFSTKQDSRITADGALESPFFDDVRNHV